MIQITDTTLRDGRQTPDIDPISVQTAVEFAQLLERAGVYRIEAGMPVSNQLHRNTIRAIVDNTTTIVVGALALSTIESVNQAAECLEKAIGENRGEIHIFIATSDNHLTHKLRLTEDEALERAVNAVRRAVELGAQVRFSCEDATSTPIDRLIRFYRAVVDAGATTINVPDTLGKTDFFTMERLVRPLRKEFDPAQVRICVHCHNDFGMAVANSIAAVIGGADEIECSIGGLGERTGNADMAQVIASLELQFEGRYTTGMKPTYLYSVYDLIARATGRALPVNYPVMGNDTHRHSSGIHQAAGAYYEAIPRGMFGKPETSDIALTPESGRKGIKKLLDEHQVPVTEPMFEDLMARVRRIWDRGDTLNTPSLVALARDVQFRMTHRAAVAQHIEVQSSGTNGTRQAIVTLKVSFADTDTRQTVAASSQGAVHAAAACVEELAGLQVRVVSEDQQSLGEGAGAFAHARVVVSIKERPYVGEATDQDAQTAVVKALVYAVSLALESSPS